MRRAEGEGGRGGGDRAHAGTGEENEGKKGEEEKEQGVCSGKKMRRGGKEQSACAGQSVESTESTVSLEPHDRL